MKKSIVSLLVAAFLLAAGCNEPPRPVTPPKDGTPKDVPVKTSPPKDAAPKDGKGS